MKIKCIKCGLRYRGRGENDPYVKELCWNCGFIWNCIGIAIKSIGGSNPFMGKDLKRAVTLHLKDIIIKKR